MSIRTPSGDELKHSRTQSTHRKARLEPAIRDAQKLGQNVFPPWSRSRAILGRLVLSRYLCVLGEREDWGRREGSHGKGRWKNSPIFPSSLPMRARVRLNLTSNLLSPPKHIRLIYQQKANVCWRLRAQIKQLAWPISKRQIGHRK